jgi:cytochrome c-type biogenesis protein CcsB
MQRISLTGNSQPNGMPAAHFWIALFIGALGLAGSLEFLEAKNLASADIALDQLFSYKLTGYAHLMIVASTVLYLAHLRYRAHAVGLWASSLAALGALGLLGALAVRATETYVFHRTHHIPLTSLHEVMALFSACTVLVYLAMEHVYRQRAAGAFVMPIVMAAVLFESWLMASGPGGMAGHFPSLHSYTVRLHVLVNLLAYGAFAVAAAMGLLYLLVQRGRPLALAAALGPDDLARIEPLMHRVLTFGLVLFSAAVLLGMQAAQDVWGRYWGWTPKETWSLLVWTSYAAYWFMLRIGQWRGARMACWSIAGFGLSLLCFVGVNLLAGRLHAYG